MLIDILLIIGGLTLLVKGADFLVDGSSAIAKKLNISTLIIGLSLVAFGTSAPELAVNILSALSGNPEIALGSVNGSNIANILLILGSAALITRITIKSRTIVKEIPYMLLAGVVLMVMILDGILLGQSAVLNRSEGIILLIFAGIFLYYLFLSAQEVKGGAKVEKTKTSVWVAGLMTFGGLIGLIIGAKITVDGAVGVAEAFGISQTLIAITVVAIGTSLPELVTAISAARKGEVDLIIGNVIGSNIFNILLVVGITATISPDVVPVSQAGIQDATIALFTMVILTIFIFASKFFGKNKSFHISRIEGVIMILIYIVYLVFVTLRG